MIVLIDSGGANIASVVFALERLGVEGVLSADPDVIARASHVILPGVGAAKDAMSKLQARELVDCIKVLTQPALGICLGMQLLFTHSEEGDATMLDIFSGNVRHFKPEAEKTIPHMGWNGVRVEKSDHILFRDIPDDSAFYFVHSYYAPVGDYTLTSCVHGSEMFSASVTQDNFMGCQFHPERSGAAGQQILKNFLEM
ncbi:MAG: imidazole glycerol phosphate synthase subunit HisH [Rhodospirillales bacterium]|nr:imidazole glycerol phosphate synthase subunit HisH [Rhodospirillales bacterium]